MTRTRNLATAVTAMGQRLPDGENITDGRNVLPFQTIACGTLRIQAFGPFTRPASMTSKLASLIRYSESVRALSLEPDARPAVGVPGDEDHAPLSRYSRI